MHGDVFEGPSHFGYVEYGEGLETVAVCGSVLASFAHDVLDGFEFGHAVVMVNSVEPRSYDNKHYQGNYKEPFKVGSQVLAGRKDDAKQHS
jgi:hypothetical protein